jgi:hypothetical protein
MAQQPKAPKIQPRKPSGPKEAPPQPKRTGVTIVPLNPRKGK